MIAAVDFPPDPRIERYIKVLLEKKFKVDVLCLKGDGSKNWESARIFRLPFSQLTLPKPLNWIIEYLLFLFLGTIATYILTLRERYAIIHYHNPPDFNLPFLFPLKFLGTKLIYDVHETTHLLTLSRLRNTHFAKFIAFITVQFMKLSLITADLTITVNEFTKKELNKFVPDAEIIVIPNIPDIDPRTIPSVKRDSNKMIFIHAGNLLPNADLFTLMKAAKHFEKEAIFWIAGDGPLRKELEKIAPKNVIFLGKLPHLVLLSYLKSADAALVTAEDTPHNRYATPCRAYEAAALGKPIVAAKLPGIISLLKDSCIYYIPQNVESLSDAIQMLLDPKNVKSHSKKIKKYFVQNYSWNKIKSILQNVYGELNVS